MRKMQDGKLLLIYTHVIADNIKETLKMRKMAFTEGSSALFKVSMASDNMGQEHGRTVHVLC